MSPGDKFNIGKSLEPKEESIFENMVMILDPIWC